MYYSFTTVPVIREVEIVACTKIVIPPGKPLTFCWERHGFKVYIPAGAIPGDGAPVTMSIQASIEGNYQLPDDGVLVSGVYWLTLHPPVKLAEDVTLGIQHSGGADSGLSFITAKCTQQSLPYTFKPLQGGIFSESDIGKIQVSHFSAFAIFGWKKTKCAICTYYIPQEHNNNYVSHITATPREDLIIKVGMQIRISEYSSRLILTCFTVEGG